MVLVLPERRPCLGEMLVIKWLSGGLGAEMRNKWEKDGQVKQVQPKFIKGSSWSNAFGAN